MAIAIHSQYQFGDTLITYPLDAATGLIGLTIYPASASSLLATRRSVLEDGPEYQHLPPYYQVFPAWNVDPLVQVKWIGAAPPIGFIQGRTMRGGEATISLKFERQEIRSQNECTTIVTYLRSTAGYTCQHHLSWCRGGASFEVRTVFRNDTEKPVSLEMLSSFSIGGITPFAVDDAPDRLLVHRFRCSWSAEGRLDTQSVEQLHLERSWSGYAVRCERFGQVGTMPTNGFFPFIAVEDRVAGVLWGAQLAWAGSWQMEAYRRDDCLSISGGLADREFGHWVKTIAPGETFTSPPATLATVVGDLDALCHRLTAAQQRAADAVPEVEADLPIIFNDWPANWGRPMHDNLLAIANRLRGSPVRYLVIDSGWYKGEWTPNLDIYPDGLAATAAAIREHGLIPGLWFEFESVASGETPETMYLSEHVLRRDGRIPGRRCWDLNDPFVIDYLSKRVIGLLRETGMGYLKVDYNETIGLGVDGAESLGEGLRRHIEGIYCFFEQIRQELPELVIENCSAGGFRLEPSLMARSSMGGFSDAHETREIPIIAANLHRLILPRQEQIWTVLRNDQDDRRLLYVLSAGFLGRMCLSGDVVTLSDHQWSLALQAQRFYRQVAPIIKHGRSYRFGPAVTSYRHPRGWQAMTRVSDNGQEALVVAHSFGADVPSDVEIALPGGAWQIAGSLHANAQAPSLNGTRLRVPLDGEYCSSVVHLVRS